MIDNTLTRKILGGSSSWSSLVKSGARNHLQANKPLEFSIEIAT
jgi:hypothetical protein